MGNLEQSIERFLRTGEGFFEDLSLELFHYQFEKNHPYRAYCRSLGMTEEKVTKWREIPAVPIQAFKSAALATFPVGQAAAIFESSGTTVKTPSRHYLKTLAYYETSLKMTFAHVVIPTTVGDQSNRDTMLILTPPPAEAPRSSLSWMMDVVKRQWGTVESQYMVRHGRLDIARVVALLMKLQASETTVILLGTTISFLAFFDYCREQKRHFDLPKGSQLMDTGGMKTHMREISRQDFIRQAGEFLAIPEDQCINEYGMCELSSQFYGRGDSSYLEGPAWVRTLVIDPATGLELPDGKQGLLRHIDLANVDSVMAIQTEDVGYKKANGFHLLGRASGADVKGCSISAEAFLA